MQSKTVPLSSISVNEANPRTISDDKFSKLINSLLVFPKMLSIRPIAVDNTNVALGGNMRYRALSEIAGMPDEDLCSRLADNRKYQKLTKAEQDNLLEYWQRFRDKPEAEVVSTDGLTEDEYQEFIIKDNSQFGSWSYEDLSSNFDEADLLDWGLDVWEMKDDLEDANENGGEGEGSAAGSLTERFVVPPFSVLDTRQGYWQKRKKAWRERIGELGGSRKDTNIKSPEIKYKDLYQRTQKERKKLGISFKEYIEKHVPPEVLKREDEKILGAGTSLFDPVLSEISCKWFTPYEGAKIFDPFAGDTYKGLVFSYCGHEFTGIELREEQIKVNEKVIDKQDAKPKYILDDGRNVAKHFKPESQDLLFSCPPYFDLEKYSNLDNDASNAKSYSDFIAIIKEAYTNALTCLKQNRFAVIVIGDVRNKKTGAYYDVLSDFKRIFIEAGTCLWNEIILVETGASTALRASRYMDTRKVGKMHQNILVFYKGDPKKIKENFPKIEFNEEEINNLIGNEETEELGVEEL